MPSFTVRLAAGIEFPATQVPRAMQRIPVGPTCCFQHDLEFSRSIALSSGVRQGSFHSYHFATRSIHRPADYTPTEITRARDEIYGPHPHRARGDPRIRRGAEPF